jgi:hypothetical protein
LKKSFEDAGFKPQVKQLVDFQEGYGLEGEEDEEEDEDDDDEGSEEESESGDEMEE